MLSTSDGPPGLEAKHQWNPAVGNNFTMNDIEGSYPFVDLVTIQNYYSLPESDDNRIPQTGLEGETILPGKKRGKTITYVGFIIGVTRKGVLGMRRNMVASFSEMDIEGTMYIDPHNSYSSHAWEFKARVLALEIDDEIIAKSLKERDPYKLAFDLTLRLSNPFFTLAADPTVKSF